MQGKTKQKNVYRVWMIFFLEASTTTKQKAQWLHKIINSYLVTSTSECNSPTNKWETSSTTTRNTLVIHSSNHFYKQMNSTSIVTPLSLNNSPLNLINNNNW